MSEAEDAEREVEDLFNEEILGIKEPERDEAPFPTQDEPESKPVDEIADPDEAPEEEAPEAPPGMEEELAKVDLDEPPPPEQTAEEAEAAYLTWAKKKYGDDFDRETVAKAAYEQEKLIGKQAEERQRQQEEDRKRGLQQAIDRLHTYGVLTPEEEAWVEERAMEGDLDEAAKACFDHQRYDLYAALTDRFVAMGGAAAQYANSWRSNRIQDTIAFYSQPEPSPEEQQRESFRTAFSSVGLNLEAHGPTVLAKAQELGGPYFYALENGDEGQRAMAARALFDLATATQTEVSRHRLDDVVAARVQEEKLRQGAAGVTQGGAQVEKPKSDPFWDSYNEEVSERGWDGNRPSYREDS